MDKKIGLSLIVLLAVLLLSGAVYQFVCTKLDEKAYPAPGKLIDIGGYKLHILCSGHGGPTVVLDAGMGGSSLDWSFVQPEIAKFARVCSYDRAGYGWSDASPLDRTSRNIAEELHLLLKNAGEQGPYILVGHSFGGPNVRLYADKYPEEVAGLVLVDSSHEDQLKELQWSRSFLQTFLARPEIASFIASIGLTRIFNHQSQIQEEYKAFPSAIREAWIAKASTTKYAAAVAKEMANFEEDLNELKQAKGVVGDKPLIVITAGKSFTSEETGFPKEFLDNYFLKWQALQKDLLTKSTNAKQVIAERSGHMINHEQPEIIVESVHQMVEEISHQN